MTIYTVVHTYEFNEHGVACTINLHHFISKQAAIDNMYSRFEKCWDALDKSAVQYDSDINDFRGYAYICHFKGDPWGADPQEVVYDHDWRVIAEQL